MLDGLLDVLCMMDDIIIFGDSHGEHDARVKTVLKRLEENGVTSNFGKVYIPEIKRFIFGSRDFRPGELF